jgi:hypothetical protein
MNEKTDLIVQALQNFSTGSLETDAAIIRLAEKLINRVLELEVRIEKVEFELDKGAECWRRDHEALRHLEDRVDALSSMLALLGDQEARDTAE